MLRNRLYSYALHATAAACGIGAIPETAGAQPAPGLQVLEVPTGRRLQCKNVSVRRGAAATSASAALVTRRFLIPRAPAADLRPGLPPLPERELMVTWDSAGRPRALTDHASPRLRDATTIIATFPPDGTVRGRRMLIAVDSARVEAAIQSGDLEGAHAPGVLRPPVSRDLNPVEAAQARALAQWLWPRRCPAAT